MTSAARRLLVSQSAVSTAVAQLERALGVQLLIRHHAKGLSLTAAGARFLQESRNLLAHADELVETAQGWAPPSPASSPSAASSPSRRSYCRGSSPSSPPATPACGCRRWRARPRNCRPPCWTGAARSP
ncbi:LysR family transcriptional regulator [Phaeacidiphilus oryzae]|uniref:LysR family transcriptional regulator n=1 Tax=Phaeacidiphilus oryzae TaxID=348818 RepID=UPI00389AFBA3